MTHKHHHKSFISTVIRPLEHEFKKPVNGILNAFQQDFKIIGGATHSLINRGAGILDNLTNPTFLLAIAAVGVIIVMNKK
jgi:hypothetical protein